MDGRPFISSHDIDAPSMHGQVNGERLAIPRPDPQCELHAALHISFSGCTFSCLALLQSSCPSKHCLTFLSTTLIHFLFIPLLLGETHSAVLALAQQSRFSKLVAMCGPSKTPG